jgi:small subunit ribosomal protein S5
VAEPVAEKTEGQTTELDERVVSINRCSKVVKGGRNFHFSALVVVGDRRGRVGVGFGKANEVSDAIRKGGELARKAIVQVPRHGDTLPHAVTVRAGGSLITMRPASKGTGLIAGGGMRAVLELAGVHDVLGKTLGSKNPVNVVKATMLGIARLRTKQQILAKRGVSSL